MGWGQLCSHPLLPEVASMGSWAWGAQRRERKVVIGSASMSSCVPGPGLVAGGHKDPLTLGAGRGESGGPRLSPTCGAVAGGSGRGACKEAVSEASPAPCRASCAVSSRVSAELCTDPALPCTFLPGGARSLLGDGSFVDCTEIGTLFSCSSQILLMWIIQTDVKCFSKMENKQLCLFPLSVWFGFGLGWPELGPRLV